MGTNQGLIRLKNGIKRKISKTEVNRGYFFLSLDKKLCTLLNVEKFILEINGNLVTNRRIDNWGRFQIPRHILRRIGSERYIFVELISKSKIRIDPATNSSVTG
ncbi:hypothetical protein ACFLWC_04655 [Chloroflexota bacterium]